MTSLSPDTPAKDDTIARWEHRRSAIMGSHSLATAILRAKGYPPPPAPKLPPHPKRKAQRAARAGRRELDRIVVRPPRPSTAQIQRVVADYYEISVADLTSKSRRWEISHPRQVAFYLTRQLTPRSYPDIARRFGGFDHTSVISGVRQVERRLKLDGDLAADVEELWERLAV